MKRLLCIMLALFMLLTAAGCKRDTNAGLTESEIAQINAAQDAMLANEIPQSWLHPEGEEPVYENIAYKINSLTLTDTLPENLQKQFIEGGEEIPLTKYKHFLILNLTMKNTLDAESEVLLEMKINSIDNGISCGSFGPYVFDKHQHPVGHDYCRYTFQPNEEVTSDLVFVAHERDLVGDLYFSPSFYSCSYVWAANAPFERRPQADNPNLEIWDEMFNQIELESVEPFPMPKPAQGTLKKSDVIVNDDKDELKFIIKNMERDYALEYFERLIFEGYNVTPYYIDKKMTEYFEPTVDTDTKNISIIAGHEGFVYDIVYTELTKEMRVNICSIDKAWRASGVSADK